MSPGRDLPLQHLGVSVLSLAVELVGRDTVEPRLQVPPNRVTTQQSAVEQHVLVTLQVVQVIYNTGDDNASDSDNKRQDNDKTRQTVTPTRHVVTRTRQTVETTHETETPTYTSHSDNNKKHGGSDI